VIDVGNGQPVVASEPILDPLNLDRIIVTIL